MDLHTNDSSESAAGVFVSDKCQIPVGGIPQQEPDRPEPSIILALHAARRYRRFRTNWGVR